MSHSATKKVATNTLVQVIGKAVVLVLAAVSFGYVTRYLGPTGYGYFTTALVYLSLFGIAADLGLFTIAIREMSREPERIPELLGNILSLRLIFSLLTLGLAIGVAWLLPYVAEVKIAVAIASLSVFFGLLNSSLLTVLQAKLRMEFSVISDIVGKAFTLAAVIYVAQNGLGFYAIIWTAVLGSLATFLVSFLFVRRFTRITFHRDTRLWKELFRESVPLGAALVISQVYYRVDIMMLSLMRPAADVGIYGAAFKVIELTLTIPGFFLNSVLPVLSERLKHGPKPALSVVQKSVDALMLLGCGLAVGGIVLAPDVLRLAGGGAFVSGAPAFRILLVSMLFSFLVLLFVTVSVAARRQVTALKIGAFSLVLNIALNLALIPLFGLMGAAVVTLVSEAVAALLYLGFSRRTLRLPVSFRVLPKAAVAVVAAGLLMWLLRDWFVVSAVIGALTYSGILLLLRAVPADTLRELRVNFGSQQK